MSSQEATQPEQAANDTAEEPPDPSAVEPLGQAEGVYQRDESGNLRPLPPDVVKWDGEWHRVRFFPVPFGQLEQYQELGDDTEMRALAEILEDKVHTPSRSVEEWLDTEPEQFMAVMTALVEEATGEAPDSEFHAEVQAELAKRDSPGN